MPRQLLGESRFEPAGHGLNDGQDGIGRDAMKKIRRPLPRRRPVTEEANGGCYPRLYSLVS
jgi:hypothetical protein